MKQLNTEFVERYCYGCERKIKPVTKGETNETHGYKLVCPECGVFLGWGGKVKPLKKNGKRSLSSNWTADRLRTNYCQWCGRRREMLGPGTLEIHHIVPIKDGGEDHPSNIMVLCTACHKEVHHRRLYYNAHLARYFDDGGKHDNQQP